MERYSAQSPHTHMLFDTGETFYNFLVVVVVFFCHVKRSLVIVIIRMNIRSFGHEKFKQFNKFDMLLVLLVYHTREA